MDRQILAYILIAVMTAGLLGLWLYLRYHGRERTHRRRRIRENASHRARMEANEEAGEDGASG